MQKSLELGGIESVKCSKGWYLVALSHYVWYCLELGGSRSVWGGLQGQKVFGCQLKKSEIWQFKSCFGLVKTK